MSIDASAEESRGCWCCCRSLAFVGLGCDLLAQLMSGRDAGEIPSALIGQPAPAMKLAALEGSACRASIRRSSRGR